MKHFGIALLFSLAVGLSGCGGGSSSSSAINGNWTATLTGSQDLSFNVTLSQSGGVVSVTNLSFTTSQSCFDSGATATGAFTLMGTLNGVTTGSFQMTVQSGASNANGSNTLVLTGTLTNNSIAGNWTLSGSGLGCTGSGTFTMTG
jgi:hypothetical protein